MRKKIIHSFLITFVISYLIGFTLLYAIVYNNSYNQQKEDLLNNLDLVERLKVVDTSYEILGDYYTEKDMRITIIHSDGQVVYDNQKSQIKEKHLQRTEVKQALDDGVGTSVRYSNTMHQTYLYVARYEKDNDTIIRLAKPFDSIIRLGELLLIPFCISLVISLSVVYLLSNRMTNAIMKPFHNITNKIKATNVEKEELSFENYDYPELNEITLALNQMSKRIQLDIKKLKKEKRIRQEFFSNASHELKTPLTSIRGYSELLRSGVIDDPVQINACLDSVLRESDHMTTLINDILLISKLETDDLKVEYTYISTKSFMNAIIDDFMPQLSAMNLTLESDIQDITIYANKDHMRNLFNNLISNAIKYNKQNGKVTVLLYRRKDMMNFVVKDTGIGISKKDQGRIFQRFYRVDKQRSKVIPGTGLGLSIVKHIVQFYKGTIQLESLENEGTTIMVKLPILIYEKPEP